MPRKKPTLKDTNTPAEVDRALASIGIFTRVAKSAGVTPGHALAVARGDRSSKRIVNAIVREVRRIDREAAQLAASRKVAA